MKEDPLFCFLLAAEEETSIFHISTQDRGQADPSSTLSQGHSFSGFKKTFGGLVEVEPFY